MVYSHYEDNRQTAYDPRRVAAFLACPWLIEWI